LIQSILIALVAPLAALTALLSYLALTRRAAILHVEHAPRPEEPPTAAEMARNVRQMESIIESLSGGIENHARDVAVYDDALEEHRNHLQSAQTMRSLRDLERLLQEELDSMHRANEQYREQLDAANKVIEQQRAQLEALQLESSHDFLTEVPNRRAFDRRLHEEIDRFRRGGPPFSLVLMDIDHFKQVNDRYGHTVGDEVLQYVAAAINRGHRATDFTARYGGEEFALILPCTGEQQAAALIEKVREEIAASTVQTRMGPVVITISAGVAEILPADQGATVLIQRADDRLYRAKQQGRNQVCSK
jgi:diguanylate cyclase (GGDEF)-like protein